MPADNSSQCSGRGRCPAAPAPGLTPAPQHVRGLHPLGENIFITWLVIAIPCIAFDVLLFVSNVWIYSCLPGLRSQRHMTPDGYARRDRDPRRPLHFLLSFNATPERSRIGNIAVFLVGIRFPCINYYLYLSAVKAGVHFFSAEGETAMQRCGWVSQDPLWLIAITMGYGAKRGVASCLK